MAPLALGTYAMTLHDNKTLLYNSFFDDFSLKENDKNFSTLIVTLMHMVSHLKRLIYSANNDYMKKTPDKYEFLCGKG